MSVKNPAFLTGIWSEFEGPLSRFLPSIPQGMGAAWLAQTAPPGSWILDPFATDPYLALETARQGYSLLVAANNPILRFILEMLAAAPTQDDLRATLAELAASRKGDERLEHLLQALYETNCAACGKAIQAQAFLWERQAEAPYARLYTCPYCGDAGEYPITQADLEHLRGLPPAGLHRARALEKVASIDDPVRADVEAAVNCYLPRSLYVIFTLVNKLDSPGMSSARRALLTALLLVALDEGSTLWAYPSSRSRPRQLTIPPRFYENNLWLSLEKAVNTWATACAIAVDSSQPQPIHPVAIKTWPERGGPGEITVFEGRLKDLAPQLGDIQAQGILTAVPRPNQAFWTLSALWTGWLWGRERVQPIKSVLSRRRYDWGWQAAAIQSALANLSTHAKHTIPGLGILAEAEPPFLTATLIGIQNAGLDFQGLAIRSDPPLAQVHFQTVGAKPATSAHPRDGACKTALREYLAMRGEPCAYLPAYAAVLSSLASEHYLALPPAQEPSRRQDLVEQLNHIQALVRTAFADRALVDHFGGKDQHSEVGTWWLHEQIHCEQPLSDRVEVEVVRYLQKHPGCTLLEVDRSLCSLFPGLLTPSSELLQVCLESYGVATRIPTGLSWQLRSEDQPATRRQENLEIRDQLIELGQRFGYQVSEQTPLQWLDAENRPAWTFFIQASGLVGRCLLSEEYSPAQSLLIFPGGRANLVSYKIQNDPRLEKAVHDGWKLIKFRYLRQLTQDFTLDRESWSSQLNGDPLEFHTIPIKFY